MEKSTKIVAQVYGYAVCLVTVITFLISTTALVTAVVDLGDPMHSGYTPQGSPSLASFENYRLDVMKSFQKGAETGEQSYAPTEQTLRSMYDAAKNDKIQSSNHQSDKTILISSLIIVICMILFFTHWNWLRRLTKSA
ncbi:MAG: hypothetical protein ACHQF0_10540 [Chitinophagales bacterium]